MRYTEQRASGAQRLFDAVYRLPGDLLLVATFVAVVDVIVYILPAYRVVKFIVGVPVLFFLPGYVILAIFFPRRHRGETESSRIAGHLSPAGGLSLGHRTALSFGVSVALVPLFAVGMGLARVDLRPETITGVLSAFLLVGAVVGTFSRLRVSSDDRMRIPTGQWLRELRGFLTGRGSTLDAALNMFLVLSVIVGMSGLTYAIATPSPGGDYANFMLLTRGSDGEFVSSGYPTEFTRGQEQSLVVAVENQRNTQVPYEVVVEIQRVRGEGSDFTIIERRAIDRFRRTVGPGVTWYRPHTIAPQMAGEELRLAYYLYRGEAPQLVSDRPAAEHLHLWVNVSLAPDDTEAES